MKNIFIVTAILVAGCATTDDVRRSTPTIYQNTAAAQPVAKCILAKLEPQFSMASVQYRDTTTGASVWVEMRVAMGKDIGAIIDVDNTPSGSTTKFYSNLLAGDGKYRSAITACQAI